VKREYSNNGENNEIIENKANGSNDKKANKFLLREVATKGKLFV
jgi:hypothetical protein